MREFSAENLLGSILPTPCTVIVIILMDASAEFWREVDISCGLVEVALQSKPKRLPPTGTFRDSWVHQGFDFIAA